MVKVYHVNFSPMYDHIEDTMTFIMMVKINSTKYSAAPRYVAGKNFLQRKFGYYYVIINIPQAGRYGVYNERVQ